MAYVPPALRKKQQQAAEVEGVVNDVSVEKSPSTRGFPRSGFPGMEDIYEHFWPIDNDKRTMSTIGMSSSTLHSSADDPDNLKYVTLFYDANPRWASDKIIFAKSNLDLLPGGSKVDRAMGEEQLKSAKDNTVVLKDEPKSENGNAGDVKGEEQQQTRDRRYSGQDTAPQVRPPSISAPESTVKTALGPIAIFEQVGDRGGGMRFIGYHKLARVQFLEPRSEELVRMLEQKWSRRDKYGNIRQIRRDSTHWLKSLGFRWAVLKFEVDEEANAQLAPPDIKINPDRESHPAQHNDGNAPKKSVNELLREMRLGNSEAQAQEQADGKAQTASDDKPS